MNFSAPSPCRLCGAELSFDLLSLDQPAVDAPAVTVCAHCRFLSVAGDAELLSSSARPGPPAPAEVCDYATAMEAQFRLEPPGLVVAIEPDDGAGLAAFARLGVPVLAVAPRGGAAAMAAPPLPSAPGPVDGGLARRLRAAGHRPALVLGGDLLMRSPDLAGTLSTLAALGGVLSFDVSHLVPALAGLALDRLFAAPQPALSLLALEPLLASAGLRLFDAEPLAEGWLRLHACAVRAPWPERPGLMRVRAQEAALRLDRAEGYADLAARADRALRGLADFLASARHGRKSVAALGSLPAAALVARAAGIGPQDIAFCAEPGRQKRATLPDLPIPLTGTDELRRSRPDFILILPGQPRDAVLADYADLRRQGTCFVAAFPTVTVMA